MVSTRTAAAAAATALFVCLFCLIFCLDVYFVFPLSFYIFIFVFLGEENSNLELECGRQG